MAKYRRKPVVIEAEQFNPSPNAEGEMFLRYPIHWDKRGNFLLIHTLEGDLRADPGDWIITGVQGEQYPCKPDIFSALYEPACSPAR